ncbi:MAG: hypothetical protein ACK4R2_04830, partial [Roseateles sp.]
MASAALAACGGGGGGAGGEGGGGDPALLQLPTPGEAIIKLRSRGDGWVALAETPRPLALPTVPQRRLLVSQPDGRALGADYRPPAGWALLDFALHPSGQISLLLAGDRTLRLARLSATGQPLHEQAFTDALAPTDPFVGDPRAARDPQSLMPYTTRDTGRLAALGEDLALAFRSGRHAVPLHRLAYTAAGGFAPQWRRLVEPGVFIGARFVTSGSFDPFQSLDQQWRLCLDADAQGRIAVALSLDYTELAAGHAEHFGENIDPELYEGALLTQFSPTGQRLGTAVIDTQQRAELHALRWVGGQVAVAGRVRSRQVDEGWDAFLALVPAGATAASAYRVLDLEAGDLIFDVAATADGRLLVAGSAGYTQNPAGASVSEAAQPLLALLGPDGQLQQRLALAAGPR